MLRFIALCLFLVSVRGESTEVLQCLDHEGDLPINTYIRGCITPPCVLPQLQDAVIDITFRAPRVITRMRSLVQASINIGIPISLNYDLGASAVTCNFLTNTYCPVMRDEVVQYTLNMYIERFFPLDAQVVLEFRIVDEFNVPILCSRMSIRVGPPVSAMTNGTVV